MSYLVFLPPVTKQIAVIIADNESENVAGNHESSTC